MGRIKASQGLEIRPASMRVHFTWQGKRYRPTLTTGGVPMQPTPANIRFAERLAAEVRERIRLGTFSYFDYFGADTGSAQTLEKVFERWMGGLLVEKATLRSYKTAGRFWCDAVVDGQRLGDQPVAAILPSTLRRALASRRDLKASSLNQYLVALQQALKMAVRDKALRESPAADIPMLSHQKEQPDPYTPDEVAQILARIYQREGDATGNLFKLWAWTGMRPGELMGLRWPNVDLAGGSILVCESVSVGEHKRRTKTGYARTVLLNSEAQAALMAQKKHTILAGEFVFLDPRYGLPWASVQALNSRVWGPALKSMGWRHRKPYALRHSYATRMLMSPGGGMNPAFCARQLGHSVSEFLSTYSRWIDGLQDDGQMALMEAGIQGMSPECPQDRQDTP